MAYKIIASDADGDFMQWFEPDSKELFEEAFKLLARANELLLAARVKHEQEMARRLPAESHG